MKLKNFTIIIFESPEPCTYLNNFQKILTHNSRSNHVDYFQRTPSAQPKKNLTIKKTSKKSQQSHLTKIRR